jgi:hypothetical protein
MTNGIILLATLIVELFLHVEDLEFNILSLLFFLLLAGSVRPLIVVEEDFFGLLIKVFLLFILPLLIFSDRLKLICVSLMTKDGCRGR